MRSVFLGAPFCAALAVSGQVDASANLLQNGSFEMFTNAGSPGESLLAPGATNLPGCTVIGGNDLLLCGRGTDLNDGSYFFDLTGITNVSPYAGVNAFRQSAFGAPSRAGGLK